MLQFLLSQAQVRYSNIPNFSSVDYERYELTLKETFNLTVTNDK